MAKNFQSFMFCRLAFMGILICGYRRPYAPPSTLFAVWNRTKTIEGKLD